MVSTESGGPILTPTLDRREARDAVYAPTARAFTDAFRTPHAPTRPGYRR